MDRSAASPDVSIVCPVFDDPEGIRRTVTSVSEQAYPTDRYELIVVDNDSTDETGTVAADLLADVPNGYLYAETDVQSSYAARNTGIAEAEGDVVAFIDADMTVPETWLSDLLTAFDRSGADYVGCNVELYVPEGEETLAARYNVNSGFAVEYYIRERHFAPTCCLAVRSRVFEAVGTFDPALVSSGDLEFGQRVHEAGFDMHYADDVTMYHPARSSIGSLTAKARRIGQGHEQLYRRYPELAASRSIVDPRNVLPPNPVTFASKLDGVSTVALVQFYLLAYWYKVNILRGRIAER